MSKQPAPIAGGTQEMSRTMSAAAVCRAKGWGPGTRIVGDEGYGPQTIKITAVGESSILAKHVDPDDWHEGTWTLSCRDWTEATS